MVGDQILRTEEEVDFLRAERVFLGLEVDAVENEVQVLAIRLHFRMVDFGERIFDCELVKMKDFGEDFGFVWRRAAEIDPHPDTAVGLEPGRVHPVDDLGGPVLVLVDRDQSPTLSLSAACAAARRATGTRYGEQLT